MPFTHPADFVKIAISAWVGVLAVNALLRAVGLAAFTTNGS